MPSKLSIATEMIASLRERYDAGETDIALAQTLGVSAGTFRRYRTTWQWPPRRGGKTRTKRRGKPAAKDGPKRDTAKEAGAQSWRDQKAWALRLHARVLDVCEAEIVAIEACGEPGGEPRVRALAALTRTMAAVRASMAAIETELTGKRGDGEADEPPVDIAELRQELARRLHRLCADGETS